MLTALSERRCFIVYKLVPKENGKTDKVPVDPATGWNSNAQDPLTWMYAHEAVAWAQVLGHPYGYGIVIHTGCGIFCVDIDGALVNGEWSPLAQAFLTRFGGCFVEVSVSGTGLHIFGSYTGAPPLHKSKNTALHIELYTELRFIALTGTNAVGDITHDATAQLHQFAHDYFEKTDEEAAPGEWTDRPHPDWAGDTDDATLLEKALKSKSMAARFGNAVTFADLWNANAAVLGRHLPPNPTSKAPYDESSADLALANHLAFWTGNDCERMQNFMVASSLNRDKWEQRDVYLRGTILKAVARQKTFAGPSRNKPVAALASMVPPPPWEAQSVEACAPPPPPAMGQDGLAATIIMGGSDATGLAPGAPPVPAAVQYEAPAVEPGTYMHAANMAAFFEGCVYVQDIHQVMTPNGIGLDKQRFDVTYSSGRIFSMHSDGQKPTDSPWDAFTKSGVYISPRVRGMYFDPRETPGNIKVRDGLRWINSWLPVDIRAIPGDVTPFLRHLAILFPNDWRVLLNYLKFMVQRKGEKCMWWPFLQGVPGNGKSFISATMAYCIGQRYTQSPTPKNIDSNFNASLYGCLFLALEDVKIADDYGTMWETIKPMVTQETLEIEQKGVDKVTREICFNGIMNSNHKAGIRKTPDDRRIGSFFAAQQSPEHLVRDGLTQEYFSALWVWAKGGDGWAHVAHYLATEAIDADFRTDYSPVTTSTAEHILVSFGAAEQEILEAARAGLAGFAGGWINSVKVDQLLVQAGRARAIPRAARQAMIESLGYRIHPGLPEGRVAGLLSDGTTGPVLYVRNDHTTLMMTDVGQIKATYEAAQKAKP